MKNILLILACSAVLFSCSKDEDEVICESTPESEPEWKFPMNPGSYWIYQWYRVDSLGVSTEMSQVDSVAISGDTIIDGELYAVYDYQILSNTRNTIYRRDDGGNIVNQLGDLDYSYVDFNESFNPQVITIGEEQLLVHNEIKDLRDQIVSVPVGDFNTVDRETHHYYEGYPALNSCGDVNALFHAYHASNVGEVKTVYFFFGAFENSCQTAERRLVEYYLAD